jgi:hypothetical protein
MRSLARIGLDRLLGMYSTHNLIMAEWQGDGPWLLVSLGHQGAGDPDAHAVHHFAIFKRTGAVHGIQHDGSVTDEPLLSI